MASSSLAPLYTHLGLDPDGGPYDSTTLKKAFFKMSKIHHPDKNGQPYPYLPISVHSQISHSIQETEMSFS